MPVVNVVDQNGEKVSQVELPEELFNVKVKPAVLHEVVTMQLASRRSGTASVKNRSDIRGSRRKLFRQKGTGRARRGDIKSPLLRGGGVVFGPKPRSFAYKVPKRVRKLALKMALTSKLKENKLVVLKDFGLKEIKTKGFLQVLSALNLGSTLIVEDRKDETLELSSRNIPYVKVLRAEGLNTYDILKYESLLLLEPVIKTLEGRLSA
ncbi:MAG: 50S ribosomal protein L4 [Deltaproteobacteria bacterium]|nr:50S ribosomal protein L4 [Deltaproteobacteria bacterium]